MNKKKKKIFSLKVQIRATIQSPHLLDLKKKNQDLSPKIGLSDLRLKEKTVLYYLAKIKEKKQKALKTLRAFLKHFQKIKQLKPLKFKKTPLFIGFFSRKKTFLHSQYLFSFLKKISFSYLSSLLKKKQEGFKIESLLPFFLFLIIIFSFFQTLKIYTQAKEAQRALEEEIKTTKKYLWTIPQNLTQGNLEDLSLNFLQIRDSLQKASLQIKKLKPLALLPPFSLSQNFFAGASTIFNELNGITKTLQQLETQKVDLIEGLSEINTHLKTINHNFETVSRLVFKKTKNPFLPQLKLNAELKNYLLSWQSEMEKIEEFLEIIPEMLGAQESKNYLVLFQNDYESRATGGFIGSFAVFKIEKGKIKSWNIPGGGSYDLKGWLTKKTVSPQPLWLINPRFEFQDLNWFPDFPTSAKKIASAYENAARESVDGIIAINAALGEKILEILGPIEMPEYNKIITSKNFREETQKAVEEEYDKKKNQPKKFIADLFLKISERLNHLSRPQLTQILTLILDSLNKKEIQIYLSNQNLQERIEKIGWAGKLENTSGDYLMVVTTNIGGRKTDGVIKQEIVKDTFLSKDGRIINWITIKRTHTGQKGHPWTGVRNVSFLRFYTPKGSKFLGSYGFKSPPFYLFKSPEENLSFDPTIREIERTETKMPDGTLVWEESDKTVFGHWFQIDPGETKEAVIVYELPFQLDFQKPILYPLTLQKQSGREDVVRYSFYLAKGRIIPLNHFPSDYTQVSNSLVLKSDTTLFFLIDSQNQLNKLSLSSVKNN